MDVQTLSPWALKLKAHLEEFSPNLVLELRAENRLNQYVQEPRITRSRSWRTTPTRGCRRIKAMEFVKDILYPPPEQPAPQ